MSGPEATLAAATIAASAAVAGLVWSIIAFILNRIALAATNARTEWQGRFEKAHELTLSADPQQVRTGIVQIGRLATERWITDEDRAAAARIVLEMEPPGDLKARKLMAELRSEILAHMKDRTAAAELAKVVPGPRAIFELYEDANNRFRWRLRAVNGQVMAVSEGFATNDAARRSIEQVRAAFSGSQG